MREYTEIEILDSVEKVDLIFSMNKWVAFRFKNDELRSFSAGFPVSLIDQRVIKFLTQGHYEGVSLSKVNSGVELEILEDRRGKEKIASAIIKKRYFEKATKEDKKLKEEINDLDCIIHEMDLRFSREEKNYLAYGNIPLRMEDRWFSFVENNTIRFCWNWTGEEVFRAKILQVDEDNWVIRKLRSSHNPKLNKKSTFLNLIENQIKRIRRVDDV